MILEAQLPLFHHKTEAISAIKLLPGIRELHGLELGRAKSLIKTFHYLHLLPSGKSHYLSYENAFVLWSIPANPNIGKFLIGETCNVWELSRLWAPDGHRENLLTQAISQAVKWITRVEKPDILVSYADPNAGHLGGIYKAASWIFDGQTEECRTLINSEGLSFGRRSFHSGDKIKTRAQVEALGYRQETLAGKFRFIKPISRKAKRAIATATRLVT